MKSNGACRRSLILGHHFLPRPCTSALRSNFTTCSVAAESFLALVVNKPEEGKCKTEIKQFSCLDELPRQDEDADVTVKVEYSNLNYKDGLIVLGKPGVVSGYPLVGGIDFSGIVTQSKSPKFSVGDHVVLTGHKCGQNVDGGYSKFARVQSNWLVKIPEDLSLKESMIIGTAGFTAMQCILHLEKYGQLSPKKGPVLVTGASGGVGSVAVAILAELGYSVTASTGRKDTLEGYLKTLGAKDVISRLEETKRPLNKQKWAGAIDTVGGTTLSTVLTQMKDRCAIASTGLAGSPKLETTVFPFILRGVRLLGVDSTLPWQNEECREERLEIWEKLGQVFKDRKEKLQQINSGTIKLDQVIENAQKILNGEVQGRLLIEL